MADETPPADSAQDDANSLENPASDSNALDASSGSTIDATGNGSQPGSSPAPEKPKLGFRQKLKRYNLYLLLFVFVLVIAGVIILVAYFQSKQSAAPATLKTQALTQNTLQQLATSDATVGDPQSVLNVQSSAVFAGKVLVRQDLEVAGSLQIGGTVALNNLTVAGTTQLGQATVNKNLSVAGDTAIQGAATIAKSLQVNGGGSFSGPVTAPQITTGNLQLNSDLTLTHHIIVGGGTPGRSSGPALGSGGSATVSGSDTAGSVTINTGGGPAAGCFITVNFTAKYNNTPRVLLTPVGSAGGGLSYYVNRSTSGFSICVSTPAPAGSSFGFDYFIVG